MSLGFLKVSWENIVVNWKLQRLYVKQDRKLFCIQKADVALLQGKVSVVRRHRDSVWITVHLSIVSFTSFP